LTLLGLSMTVGISQYTQSIFGRRPRSGGFARRKSPDRPGCSTDFAHGPCEAVSGKSKGNQGRARPTLLGATRKVHLSLSATSALL
jgi:hypothetical protein